MNDMMLPNRSRISVREGNLSTPGCHSINPRMNMQCRDSVRTREEGEAGGKKKRRGGREEERGGPLAAARKSRGLGDKLRNGRGGEMDERWRKEGGRNLERTRFSRAPFRSCICEGGGGCPAAAAVSAKCGRGGGRRRGLFWQWSHFRCLISHGIDFNTTLSRRRRRRGRKEGEQANP